MKITIVSTHRGDAALALGLSVRSWLDQGHAVEVIECFTRTEFAPFSDAGSLHANDRMSFVSATRKREDEAWLKLYRGKLTVTDLNMKDAPLRLHIAAGEVYGLTVDLAEKAAVKIRKAIERSNPAALLLPLALDAHIDRLTARTAGAEQPDTLPLAFYEDLPQATTFSDEHISAAANALSPDLQSTFVSPAGDTEATVAAKRRVAWCFDSVLDEAVTLQIADFSRRYEGRERLWANAAWRATLSHPS